MRISSCNPVTGETVFDVESATTADVTAAVTRATQASQAWAAAPVAERVAVLLAFADLLERDAARLATLITREVGKRRTDAEGEVAWSALSARWYAAHPPADEVVDGTTVARVPLGVVAAVTPWNVPLITPAWKWLPALVAGNAVLWKPSEFATGIAVATAALLTEAGLPDSVLQVLPGAADVAQALCRDSRVAAVHFTGSTRAGRAISETVAPRFARVALEMGGINCALVFADADLAAAARDIVASGSALAGQKCTAVRRVLAHTDVAEPLVAQLRRAIEGLTVGDPTSESTDIGPMVSAEAARSARATVDAATGRGAMIAAQSTLPAECSEAYFAPVLLTGLPEEDPLTTEEVFAPILVLSTFTDDEQAWQSAGSSGYGLAGAVYTRDAQRREKAHRRMGVGVLALNGRSDAVGLEQPFGGRGLSGNGFPEGGRFVYAALTDTVAIYDHG